MTRAEIRTFRGQAVAVAILLGGGVIAATALASQRWWFEKHARINGATLTRLAGTAPVTLDQAKALSRAQRVWLYEEWISRGDDSRGDDSRSDGPRGDGSRTLPSLLIASDPVICLRRIEKTFVFGSADERRRGLEFLLLSGHPDVVTWLTRAETSARRRRDDAWAGALHQAAVKAAADTRGKQD